MPTQADTSETRPNRVFSNAMRSASKRIATAIEDTSDFLDVQTNEVVFEEHMEEIAEAEYRPEATQGEVLTKEEAPEIEQKKTGKNDPSLTLMMRDKMAFFLGVVNAILTGFWMGKSPSTYYHYWTLKCFSLFALRWFSYKKIGHHYLMFELCYMGNIATMVYVYFFPQCAWMRRLTFSICSGPLMWSILAMRNSLVFHDSDKVTTLMMHASPALTAWSLRWYPSDSWGASSDLALYNEASAVQLLLYPLVFYLIWVICYYMITFVILKNRIKRKGGITMYELMVPTDRKKAMRSPLARVVLKAPEALRPALYMLCHGIAASISLLPTYFFWQSFLLHTSALLFCLGMSIWNGGNYYFKVFARKYMADLEKRSQKALKKD